MQTQAFFQPTATQNQSDNKENNKADSFDTLIAALLESYNRISEVEGISHTKVNYFFVNVIASLVKKLPNKNRIQDELEYGLRYLEDSHYRHPTLEYRYPIVIKQAIELLYSMSYFYQLSFENNQTDHEIKTAFTQIIATLKTMNYLTAKENKNLFAAIKIALEYLNTTETISDYSRSVDCGMSSGYDAMKKNGWNICCGLMLPIFQESPKYEIKNPQNDGSRRQLI